MPNPTPADRPADLLSEHLTAAVVETMLPRYGGPQHNTPGGLSLTATAEEIRLHRARPIVEAVLATLPAPALAVARQLLGTTEGEGAAAALEPQDHPGADLFVALRAAGLDADEANRRMYAYAAMVLRQEKAIAAPPAPADRAAFEALASEWEKRGEYGDSSITDRARELRAVLADDAAAGVQPPTTTADRAAALGMTPTEYRQHSHTTAVQQIQAAAQGLFAGTAIRVADALKEPDENEAEPEPLTEEQLIRQHVTAVHLMGDQLASVESWLWQQLADARDTTPPAAPAAPEETQ